MKQIALNDNQIRIYAGATVVYFRGHTYFTENRVKNLRFDKEDLTAYAKVVGTVPYDVEINFYQNGNIRNCWCDCPAFSSFDRNCKHIVAVLFALQSSLRKTALPRASNKEAAGEIIEFYSTMDKLRQREEVNLEVNLEVFDLAQGSHAKAEFKIGLERLYIVKNLKEFLYAVDDQRKMEFGKKFIFDPNKHTFKSCDQPLIDFLLELLAMEQENNSYYLTGNSIFNGKTIKLNNIYLKRFLDTLGEKPFNFNLLDHVLPSTSIRQDLILNFSLEPAGEGLALSLESRNLPIPITVGGEYLYYQNNIYQASEEQKKYFSPLLKKHLNPVDKIIFPPAYVEPFVAEVLPYLKKTGNVNISPALEKNFCQEELKAKIFFDRLFDNYHEQIGISARVELHYGGQKINPFSSVNTNDEGQNDKIIIVRDSRKEQILFDLLEQAGFTVSQGEIHLFDDERLYHFIENLLPKLQELAEIYYSEQFKGLRIRTSATYSGRIRLDETLNLLELSLEFDDISSEELVQIFNSLRLKKKYFLLRDGSFLDLKQPELQDIANLIKQMDLTEEDLKQKTIHLPIYRALYIDNFLRQKNLFDIGRDRAFTQLVQSIREPQETEHQTPVELRNILREYQETGFKWLKTLASYGLGGILADDMGLGKTLQVIAFVLSEKGSSKAPSLVIAPTSLIFNWYEEVQKFAPNLKAVVISGSPQKRCEKFEELEDADLVITSYPLIRRDADLYKDIKFAYCFLDEAQHIKNPNTINAKSVGQINAQNYFALTGTPIENSLTELWSIFNFIMPGYLLSHTEFQKKYELPISKGEDPQSLNELSSHIKPFILRRLKKDVLKELPDKIETRLLAEMTKEQEKIYFAFLKQAQGEILREIKTAGFEKSRIKILAILTRLRQICCHPGLFLKDYADESGKMKLLQEVLEDALASGHRILLFSQFTSMLEIIREYLGEQGTEYFYLDGRTKAIERQEMVRSFNEGKGKVFLISLKAGGTGLNLIGADMVIHTDPWWNPAVEDQATDRAHRIGQKNVVQVFKLITRGTIEEKIFTLQQKKKELIDAVIRPGETFLTKLSDQELKAIFDM